MTIVALAQLGAAYVVLLIPQSSTAPPIGLGTVAASAVVCNLAPVPATAPVLLGETVTFSWDDPARPGRRCETPAVRIPTGAMPVCRLAPCPTYVAVAGGMTAQIVTTAPVPLGPECVPPLGNRAVSVFPTNVSRTGSGGPGSQAIQNFQLGSPNSPIIDVKLRIDGLVVEDMAGTTNLTRLPGLWFTLPPSGQHTVTIEATNAHGCSREVSAGDLVVP